MDGKQLLRQGFEKALARQRPAAIARVARGCLAAAAGIGGVVLAYRVVAGYVLGRPGAGPDNPAEEDALLSGNVRVLPARPLAEQPVESPV